jgi:hypothetical protein
VPEHCSSGAQRKDLLGTGLEDWRAGEVDGRGSCPSVEPHRLLDTVQDWIGSPGTEQATIPHASAWQEWFEPQTL